MRRLIRAACPLSGPDLVVVQILEDLVKILLNRRILLMRWRLTHPQSSLTESVFSSAAVYSRTRKAISPIVATASYKTSSIAVPFHPYVLPTVTYHGKEYAVDTRQEEFRNVKYGESPIFVPFNSALGETLLGKYQRRRRDSHNQTALAE